MKIKYAILFLFMGLLGQAQTLKFGIKAGANYSDPSSQNSKISAPLGYHVGVLAELKFSKFALQPELLYSGLKINFNGNYVQSEVKASYLTVPILVKVTVLKRFSLDLGPHFSYALSKNTATSLSGVDLGGVLQINNFDYGVTGGVSANLTNHLFLQLRAIYGFEDITEKDSNPLLNVPAVNDQINSLIVKNRALQLSVGYKF